MGTWLNILNENEYQNIKTYSVKDNRFQTDDNRAIWAHLQDMYNKHVQLTGKIICGGEEILYGDEIGTLIELLEEERQKLKKIYLDEWEFQRNPRVNLKVGNEKYSPSNFDSTKAFLATRSVEKSEYEIRYGKFGDLKLELSKNWMKVSKVEIEDHINSFLNIITEAKSSNKYLFFSYW